MKPKILFIINPIAGHKKAPLIKRHIESSGIQESFEIETAQTQYRNHAVELAGNAVREGAHAVIAVGGDGTVNESARALVGTSTALGIIQAGSGNGLARHLKLPSNLEKALLKIRQNIIAPIDTLEINGRLSLNVSGFGFDGYVAWLFDKSGNRGLSGYTRIALKEYFRYKSVEFILNVDNKKLQRTAHMVVIANASQFGNAAIIAPQADLKDGLMDVIIVKKPPLHKMPDLFYRMFTGNLRPDENTDMLTCRNLKISASSPVHLHIDGEPSDPVTEVVCRIRPLALNVIC